METGKEKIFGKVSEALKDLPVAKVVGDVVSSVKQGKVTLLTGETGSGKTLLGNCELADASDGQVLVLVPRRFLAVNAAQTVAEIGGLELGKEVGYGIGSVSSDRSKFSPDTKLLFTTYGYALRAGLLDTAKTVVCDEVHEAGIDTSLARAMLHKRMQHDKSLHVVEMSATLNAQKQAAFWQDVAATSIHHADGKSFPCEARYVNPDKTPLIRVVRDLIKNEHRKGIAVFLPGVKEVESVAERLRQVCRESKLNHVEVSTIYGDMDEKERDLALKAPAQGNVKILVGTNVIESGMNIKWLDTGVSDGMCKVPYFRESGAEALIKEELPQWRLVQQEGRVKRFSPGIFVLCSEMNKESRPLEATAEITRMSLNSLVMHAARYGIDPTSLKYDAQIDKKGLLRAKHELMRLELLDKDWILTEKGDFVTSLPVGAEAGAMMWAVPPAIRDSGIELVAIAEVGSLRADFDKGHDMHDTSDVLDALMAFKKLGMEATQESCEKLGVSWKRYQEARDLVVDLHRRLGEPEVEQRPASERELVQILLAGSVNRLFERRDDSYFDLIRGEGGYMQDKCSSITEHNGDRFAIAHLREIPKQDDPLVIAQQITTISKEALCEFAASREGVLTDIHFSRNHKKRDSFTARYFGETPVTINIPLEIPAGMRRLIEPAYSEFLKERAEKFPDEKPRGEGNTQAVDTHAQQQQKRRRG